LFRIKSAGGSDRVRSRGLTRAGLGLFLLEAGAGTAFLLLFFPPRTLGKGFFSLHGAISFSLVLLAATARPAGLSPGVALAAAGILGLYSMGAHLGRAALARP